MYFDGNQLFTAFLAVFFATAVASLMIFQRDRWRTQTHAWGTVVLGTCAVIAIGSWMRFGEMHSIFVDADGAAAGMPHRHKIEKHQPMHFHEFFHYYLGAKYFRDFGYEGLYDCTTLADKEIAQELGIQPHISSWVRDLDDVLRDKPYDTAIKRCQDDYVAHMSPERWATFKNDIRELQRLVPDDWWGDVVYDAGFNPPPSWVLLGGALANIIPIRALGLPTYLMATSLDMLLLVACFLVLRRAFGPAAAAMATVFFGASFIASYGWNGGAFLRYTWVAAVVFGIAATRHGRWALAGAMFAASTCDRLFPAGFAVGAALPLAWRALHSRPDRQRLKRFAIGFGATAAALVIVSTAIFGFEAWRVFFSRILRHGDVYYVMHIGLKKVVTWRDWVAGQNFHGHVGLQHFHDWNVHLRETWTSMRWLVIPVQLLAAGGATWSSLRRRPHESALLFGCTAMFCFSLPANYYYVVLALVPAVLLRAAITAPTVQRRIRDWAVLMAFIFFWSCTLLAPNIYRDDIVYDHFICVVLLVFLGAWILAWIPWNLVLAGWRARVGSRSPHPGGTAQPQPPPAV